MGRTGPMAARAALALSALAASAAAAAEVAVLELYTSQGCSSCPPAEELFARLAAEPDLPAGVVPLAFHVDYWDYLGWPDPYAEKAFSDRQRRYAPRLGTRQIYTPQLVVNGARHLVGPASRAKLDAAIRAAGVPAPGRVSLRVTRGEAGVRVEAAMALDTASGAARLRPTLALYRHLPATRVTRGENAGRELVNAFTVRALWTGEAAPGGAGDRGRWRHTFPADAAERGYPGGVALLLTGATDGRVYLAGRADLPASPAAGGGG